jgi:transposase-like protein
MEDYPKTLVELEKRFSSDKACREYLFALRWPTGFKCPRCQGEKAWPVKGTFLECSTCDYQVSVTSGTIFERSRSPLSLWFRAIWWVTSQKNGASALGLKRILGLGSYETAWTLLHKIRRAMVRPGRDRLGGQIEVDETYLGGLEEGLRGRQVENKAMIAIAAQVNGKGIGRIRMKRIPDASSNSLHAFIKSSAELGSEIISDAWTGYSGLTTQGYRHTVINLSRSSKSPSDLLPRVHRIASLLKRWLMGTHQGAVSHDHLDYYLDEFTFRFNRRTSTHRGKLFYRLLEQAVQVEPAPYQAIIKHVRGLKHGKHRPLC